jgi:hypothetical protein
MNRAASECMDCEVNVSGRRLREWLHTVGWSFKSAASGKGEYVDGHERPDVVAARVIFVHKMTALFEKMEHYQDGPEKEMEVVMPRHDVQARQHVFTVQDESCFFLLMVRSVFGCLKSKVCYCRKAMAQQSWYPNTCAPATENLELSRASSLESTKTVTG